MINKKCIENLENCSKNIYISGIEVLVRLLENIIKEPENGKYRKIRLENKIIKEKLLILNGIKDALFEIGFYEVNGELHLSSNVLIATVKKYREFILNRLEIVKSDCQSKLATSSFHDDYLESKDSTSQTGVIQKKKTNNYHCFTSPGRTYLEKISFPAVLSSTNSELQYIEKLSDTFMQYEDADLQKYAKTLIPLEKLKKSALENIRSLQKLIIKENRNDIFEPVYDEIFLIELLNWFNTTFFSWINEISCKICKKEKKCQQIDVENGVRVEKIICCGLDTKFYRYNDVSILLQTRKGRCGEYANCFTFLCRTLGYDARFVHGNFDHVWTEVYSHCKERWVHFDPSENIYDAPLVYEAGWNREITYVTAFSFDDCQDVTWRYTSNYNKTLANRKTFSESELLTTILLLRKKRQLGISETRSKFLKKRNLGELATFLTQRTPTEDEKAGRSSGSLDWRLLRGEQNIKNRFIFTANEIDKLLRQFCLRYSCAKNLYEKFIPDTMEILKTFKSWESCVFESENIFLKRETDWKMIYLARTEDSSTAKILWKFDFSEMNLKIKKFKLKFLTKIYENGKIDISFLNESDRKVDCIENLMKFSLLVELSGGIGNVAWQHTQLFRQETGSDEFPFEIYIQFY